MEAEASARREPEIASLIYATILNHETLESAVAHRLASRLGHPDVPAEIIRQTFLRILAQDASYGDASRADILAVLDRDPACTRLVEPLLYFKGFHAIQTHRMAHALWKAGRRDFALYLQSRS
jgi:serine O-acetyltransferase